MKNLFPPFFVFILAVMMAAAQTKTGEVYFPSESEFKELKAVSPDKRFTEPSKLSHVAHGKLISDVGFQIYAQRNYEFEKSKSFTIKVITLSDMQAAYSLLTLLGASGMHSGPPGDEYSSDAKGICFAQGNHWVEIKGEDVPEDFMKRVSISVSNRIGLRQQKRPALISHFPKMGYDESTVKYFPGFKSFASFAKKLPAWSHRCGQDMEIAQAKYGLDNKNGTLSLLNFPTNEIAQDCYSSIAVTPESSEKDAGKIYVKTVGPLVGILEGSLDPGSANKILNSIQYSYSVQWIYEKKGKSSSILGVPIAILGTVVKSIFFVSILAVSSIAAGIGFAFARFNYRRRKKALDDDINYLKMQ
jgi:hypothetical protein